MNRPPAGHSAAIAYCAEQIRRLDRDRYLTALFAAGARRNALFALYAFNLEVARTREMVRETMLGRVRLQWWREAVDGLYGGTVRRHPVAQALAEPVRRFALSRRHFDRLLDAREWDLEGSAPRDLPHLLDYAEATSGGLVQLALQILEAPEGAGEAGRQAGIGSALTGLLRAVPFHARARRLYLPEDVLDRSRVSTARLFELRGSPELAAAVREIAQTATDHVEAARRAGRGLPRRVLPALLPASLAAMHLSRMRLAGYDVFDDRVQMAPPGRVWGLAGRMLLGRL